MNIEDFETFSEGEAGGLKKDGKVIFRPVPSEAHEALLELRQLSQFLALLDELVQEGPEDGDTGS